MTQATQQDTQVAEQVDPTIAFVEQHSSEVESCRIAFVALIGIEGTRKEAALALMDAREAVALATNKVADLEGRGTMWKAIQGAALDAAGLKGKDRERQNVTQSVAYHVRMLLEQRLENPKGSKALKSLYLKLREVRAERDAKNSPPADGPNGEQSGPPPALKPVVVRSHGKRKAQSPRENVDLLALSVAEFVDHTDWSSISEEALQPIIDQLTAIRAHVDVGIQQGLQALATIAKRREDAARALADAEASADAAKARSLAS